MIGCINVITDVDNNNSMACLRNTVFFKFIKMRSNRVSGITDVKILVKAVPSLALRRPPTFYARNHCGLNLFRAFTP